MLFRSITWISTSSWAKKIPTIQFLDPKAIFLNSVVNDHEKHGLSTEHIVEITKFNNKSFINCLCEFLNNGIGSVKQKYHQKIPIGWQTYQHILYFYLKNNQFSYAKIFIATTRREFKSAKLTMIYLFSLLRFIFIKYPNLQLKKIGHNT